jgi:hypothetical protein
MMARFQQQGGKVDWKTLTDEEVTATFSHPSGGSATITWTFEQARKAGLTGKDNWKNYPRAMLRARVVSEGIRTVFPGVVLGVYTPEEVQDIPTQPKTRDMGTVDVVEAVEEEKVDHPFSLFLADGSVYQSFPDFQGYLEGIRSMVAKITNSSKFNEEEKKAKITSLLTANSKQIEALPALAKVQLKGALIGEGSNLPNAIREGPDPETSEEL